MFCGSGRKGERRPPMLNAPLGGSPKILLPFEAFSPGPFCSAVVGLRRAPIALLSSALPACRYCSSVRKPPFGRATICLAMGD